MEHSQTLRTGIIGCGWQGHILAEAVVRSESLQLVACADPDPAAANRAATLAPDVSTHTSVEALLAEREVDAVIIATPHHLLAPIALTAIRAGKHVLAEKPVAVNERSAAEIESAVLQAGVCYMAGYSFRFSMARHVHDLLVSGAVGDIQALTGTISQAPLDSGWTAYPESGGGPLLYVGSHLVDLFLWFMGDVPTVVYATTSRRDDTGADGTSVFQIQFANGVLAQGLVTQSAPGFFYELTIHGRDGRITLRGYTFLQFEIEVVSKVLPAYSAPTIIHPLVWPDNITAMFVPEVEEFANAIREHRPPAITAADGRRVLQILDGITESGRTQQPVTLSQKAVETTFKK